MLTPMFPTWGKFERMGHDVTYGYFEVFDGLILHVTIPGLNALDEERPETSEERRLVQLGGPAFYGFQPMEEDAVMAQIRARRPWSIPTRRQITSAGEVDPYDPEYDDNEDNPPDREIDDPGMSTA